MPRTKNAEEVRDRVAEISYFAALGFLCTQPDDALEELAGDDSVVGLFRDAAQTVLEHRIAGERLDVTPADLGQLLRR